MVDNNNLVGSAQNKFKATHKAIWGDPDILIVKSGER
jgi:hypothetical protein